MIYKIRVILDSKDNVFRDIEIKEKQTLWNLHNGIRSAFSLQEDELSSFYFSDDEWTEGRGVPLEDMSDEGDGEVMSDIYMSEAFPEKGSKMLFKYGFLDLWEFYCELLDIQKEKPSVNYPITVFRYGKVPLKAPKKSTQNIPHIPLDFDDFESERFDDFENFSEDDFEEHSNYIDDDE
ncbi:IS1096 element passenger TnpR family protein [Riemerella columbipharyngis]|uniref:PRiA4b ORF-3-like protein n=1 Tax=Riemerella columbipharyngis TaxID=1071918 RepID=A0A1G7A9M4_9FLAO|nr:hypothetical protein [Riemerella columbipharyngis]SDE11638.1 pRiA4b ORF-3-like protein [Riemerella columbipharyngis]